MVLAILPLTLAIFIASVCPPVMGRTFGSDSNVTHGTAYNNSHCCRVLSAVLEGKVFDSSTETYQASLLSYFSQQQEQVAPNCIVIPTVSSDVAKAVKILTRIDILSPDHCKFAVRSGGHASFAGGSNIEHGVTIDLSAINEITVHADRSLTTVGTGQRWGNIYRKLDAMNLTLAGGRAAQVGVGGLTLGGGISYFSPRKGFVCDNVVEYEIVLASGQLINVTSTSYPDLFVALRGGSNNFGIVTRFTIRTFDQGKLWGGSVYYNISTASQQLNAFYWFNNATGYDESASLIQSFGYSAVSGIVAVNVLVYTKPISISPPVFEPLSAIQPQLFNTLRLSNLTDFTVEQGSFEHNGNRQIAITTTFKNNLPLLEAAYSLWNTTVATIAAVPGIVWSLTYEPIPVAITSKSASLGGNVLGLDCSEGSLVLVELTASWNNTSDDTLVERTSRKLFLDIDKASQAAGVFNRFKYLNYALNGQNPIDGYGPRNKARLQAVSKKFDPYRIFQDAVPGGFKLFEPQGGEKRK